MALLGYGKLGEKQEGEFWEGRFTVRMLWRERMKQQRSFFFGGEKLGGKYSR